MALTSDDVVKGLNEAGIDTAEKLTAVFGYLLAIVGQTRAAAAVQQAVIEREAVNAEAMTKISERQAALTAAEKEQEAKLAALAEQFPTPEVRG